MVVPIPLDEIDHVAVGEPVDDIADRPANDQRERRGRSPLTARRAGQQASEHGADDQCERDEHIFLPAAGITEEAEGSAGVVGAEPVPETWQDRNLLELRQRRQHPGLAQLIQHDHDDGQSKPRQRVVTGHQNHLRISPGPSTLETQRRHRPAWSGCLLASARRCQQRTHFSLDETVALTPISLAVSSARRRTSPLISRKRISSISGDSQFCSETPQCNSISASSAAPISPLARMGSSTFATRSRSASSRSKSTLDSAALASASGNPSYHVANSTLPSRSPGR